LLFLRIAVAEMAVRGIKACIFGHSEGLLTFRFEFALALRRSRTLFSLGLTFPTNLEALYLLVSYSFCALLCHCLSVWSVLQSIPGTPGPLIAHELRILEGGLCARDHTVFDSTTSFVVFYTKTVHFSFEFTLFLLLVLLFLLRLLVITAANTIVQADPARVILVFVSCQ
jgi:hypothetical protein